jgi:two-component system cell cycle sensor histidine kinase/response regulator CckA
VMRGDTAHEYAVRENLSDKLILTASFEEAMRLLSKGKHDAVIIQQLVGLQLIKKLGISNVVDVITFQETSLKPVDKPLSGFEQKFCIAVQDGEKELLALLNEGLAIAIANGTYDELYKKWFSPILPQPPVPLTLILKYILFILVPTLFLLGIVGLWYLRREVTKKTLNLQQEIKERKATEEALSLERDRAQRYLDTVEAIIVALDREGRISLINQKGCRLLGYGEDELIGQHWFSTYLPQPDGMEIVYPVFLKLIDGEIEAVEYFENSIISRKGELRQIAWHNGLMRDEQGRIIGTLSAGEDITERKRTEEALRESEEKLSRSKKMESLGLLAGGVAHDLNNVLSGIVSYPDLLLLELPEDSPFRNSIEAIKKSGDRAVAVVQDLLTAARGVATTKEPLNLNDLIDDYLDSPEFNKLKQFHPTVTVKTNLNTDLLNISGSHVHIRKVVMNLVSNASEAIKDSGNITISTVNRYVDTPLRGYDDINVGEYAVLSVSDDGSGISSDDLERIFEPFYTKKVMGRSGTGLGLAVVWNVVQDHKGYIDVTSNKNGTAFELYFLITREEISDKDVSISIKDYKGNGETILVVDDVESQREISCKILDSLGYKTKAISNGEETVEYLKKHSVDLILLDMIMDPGINGRETYERIIKIHPNQKAIIVSGFAETEEVKEAQKLGAGKYIKKPLTLERIGMAVKEELEKK